MLHLFHALHLFHTSPFIKGEWDGTRAPNTYVSSRNIYNLSSCFAEASFTDIYNCPRAQPVHQTSSRRACVPHGVTREQFLTTSSMTLNDSVHFC